jgi:2-succinyl-5-enolpyruvyl-6-hydroxy-3-cyclohexene-1-carboxylate synthase
MTDKLHIKLLAELCAFYGLKKVVISPGSRSAPITIAFHNQPEIECYIIPDERSAAYFAIGIAQYSKEPVGIICTSGTAALNYTPAIAEAFYQKLPILAITADRPPEWIDQFDGQTIDQTDIYKNFTVYQAQLPVEIFSQNEQWHLERLIRDGFTNLKLKSLPVHFNVPVREPLYQAQSNDNNKQSIQKFSSLNIPNNISEFNPNLFNELKRFKKIIMVIGMQRPDALFSAIVEKLAESKKIVIFTELLSNIQSDYVFNSSDALFSAIHNRETDSIIPDLVISFGDIILSKPLKQWIRFDKVHEHWVICETAKTPDVFQQIDKIIFSNPEPFLEHIIEFTDDLNNEFYTSWDKLNSSFEKGNANSLQSIEWSDLKAFQLISQNIQECSIVHFGNSSPIRYANFFKWKNEIEFYGNRGTAGIDGCTSTAMGMASQTTKIVTLITGDVSFLYDSNALWNKYKRRNFKLIVINNEGGNIFSLIPGPDQSGLLEEYFMTNIPVSIENLCKAFGIGYLYASNEYEMVEAMKKLYSTNECFLLEIKTNWKTNTNVWKDYFKLTKNIELYG